MPDHEASIHAPLRAGISLGALDHACTWWRRLTLRGHEAELAKVRVRAVIRKYAADELDTNEERTVMDDIATVRKCRHCQRYGGSVALPVQHSARIDAVTITAVEDTEGEYGD